MGITLDFPHGFESIFLLFEHEDLWFSGAHMPQSSIDLLYCRSLDRLMGNGILGLFHVEIDGPLLKIKRGRDCRAQVIVEFCTKVRFHALILYLGGSRPLQSLRSCFFDVTLNYMVGPKLGGKFVNTRNHQTQDDDPSHLFE